jgi:hypothetical protein
MEPCCSFILGVRNLVCTIILVKNGNIEERAAAAALTRNSILVRIGARRWLQKCSHGPSASLAKWFYFVLLAAMIKTISQ